MNQILLFADDLGGGNLIRHLMALVKEKGFPAAMYVTGSALQYLSDQSCQVEPLFDGPLEGWYSQRDVKLVIVGTTANPTSPSLDLIKHARALGVASIGVIDARMSAPLRFRGQSQDSLKYAPDWLLVPDPTTKDIYQNLGFPESKIFVFGYPHYAAISQEKQKLDNSREEQRRSLLPASASDRPIVVFVSEPPSPPENGYYPEGDWHGWGMTADRTHVALQETIKALDSILPDRFFVLRLHPKDDHESYKHYDHKVDLICQGNDGLTWVAMADLVLGMTSSLVFEAALIGRPTLSILVTPRERECIPDIIAERLILVFTPEELCKEMKKLLDSDFSSHRETLPLIWTERKMVGDFLEGIAGEN